MNKDWCFAAYLIAHTKEMTIEMFQDFLQSRLMREKTWRSLLAARSFL